MARFHIAAKLSQVANHVAKVLTDHTRQEESDHLGPKFRVPRPFMGLIVTSFMTQIYDPNTK